MREFSAPDLRLEKALSVGAKMVRPWLELLTCVLIWSASWVLFSNRMRVVNWPALVRIPVMFVGPDGAWD